MPPTVEAKGLEPSNLLTASQALYQLSYAPEAGLGYQPVAPRPDGPGTRAVRAQEPSMGPTAGRVGASQEAVIGSAIAHRYDRGPWQGPTT